MSTILLAIGFTILFLLIFALVWFLSRNFGGRSSTWLNPHLKIGSFPQVAASLERKGVWTKIIFNGKEYERPEEMPPDVRQAYERVVGAALKDADGDGIPDLMQGKGSTSFHAGFLTKPPEEPAERLRKLQELRDSALISDQEYNAKRAEILNEM